jgi:hypothetical protein
MTELVPLTLREARRYVAEHHRHSEPPVGHKFSIGLKEGDDLIGVIVAGRPVARGSDDGFTMEVTRCTTVVPRNACSRMYSAACRASFAMGYRKVITYTLAEEHGSCLLASGFVRDGEETKGGEWQHTAGPRSADMPTLFDAPKMPTGPKQRWVRTA